MAKRLISSDDDVVQRKRIIVSSSSESNESSIEQFEQYEHFEQLESPVEIVSDEPIVQYISDHSSSIGRISDGELNDIIGELPSHTSYNKIESSSSDENFIEYDEVDRVLMPLGFRYVSNKEWFVLYCQYLMTGDDSTDDLKKAKYRIEIKVKHLQDQLQSQRWDDELVYKLQKSDSFQSYDIEPIQGCDICRLNTRTSCFELSLDSDVYLTGRFCLQRTRLYHQCSHLLPNLQLQLSSRSRMTQQQATELFEQFENEVDILETYIQKGMDE